MRTATGQDSTAGIQGTLTSWTVCLRDRSQVKIELLALGRFSLHRCDEDCHWQGSTARELLPGSVFLCSSDEAPSWEVTRAAHLFDCLSVGLVSVKREVFWQKPDVQSLEGGRHHFQLQDCFPRVGCVWSLRYVKNSYFWAFVIYRVEICFLLKHSPFIKWKCPSRHLLLLSN